MPNFYAANSHFLTDTYRSITCEEPLHKGKRLICGECDHARVEAIWACASDPYHIHDSAVCHQNQL